MNQPIQPTLKLWYQQPATQWVEALPIGNGRLGAMVFGGILSERLQLNEDTLWSGVSASGEVAAWNTPGAQAALPSVRAAIFAGDYVTADQRAKALQGAFTQSYQPLGDLHLDFAYGEVESGTAVPYYRDLDLDCAVATTRYTVNGVTYTRSIFASAPDQAIIVYLTCDQAGKLTLTARLSSPLRHQVVAGEAETLLMTGKAPVHVEPSYRNVEPSVVYTEEESGPGLNFAAALTARTTGGTQWIDQHGIQIADADAVTLYLTAASGFVGFDQLPGLLQAEVAGKVQRAVQEVSNTPYDDLLATHVADHQALFRRVELDLGETDAASLPTDVRIRQAQNSDDPQLISLLFQYGRYLLIASSRPGTQPANLQGIWNDQIRPPWSSNYTININTRNYSQLVFG